MGPGDLPGDVDAQVRGRAAGVVQRGEDLCCGEDGLQRVPQIVGEGADVEVAGLLQAPGVPLDRVGQGLVDGLVEPGQLVQLGASGRLGLGAPAPVELGERGCCQLPASGQINGTISAITASVTRARPTPKRG